MSKTHLKIEGVDMIGAGQTHYEYLHQTACGYVRDKVTTSMDGVDCSLCLKSEQMRDFHLLNKTFSDSQGCY